MSAQNEESIGGSSPDADSTGAASTSAEPNIKRHSSRRLRLTRSWVPGLLRQYGIVWATVFLFVLLSLLSGPFATSTNLLNILDQQSTVLIVGAALTIAMIAGEFDVSPSSIFILASVTSLQVANATHSIVLGAAAALGVGVAAGAINGLVATVAKVNSFIGTLATSFVFFGVGFIVSNSSVLTANDPNFQLLAQTKFLGITTESWIAIVFVAIMGFLLSQTRFGRHVFAVGANKEAARLSGVRVEWVAFAALVLVGLASGLGGLLATSSVTSAQASDDYSLVFTLITAVVVGGTSISGGEGAIWRTVVGVFFIAFVANGFDLLGTNPIYQRIILGGIILVAVWYDARSREQGFVRRARRLPTPETAPSQRAVRDAESVDSADSSR